MHQQRSSEIQEAGLLLRWAAQSLTQTERVALGVLADGGTLTAAAERRGCSKQAIQQAQRLGIAKMRRNLAALRISSTRDVLTLD